MEHLSNNLEDHPNQHKNSHKLCDETGRTVVNLMESNWKLRTNMIRISQWVESHCGKILASAEINKSKRAGLKITVWDPSRKVNDLSKGV